MLNESGLWSADAIERQLAHVENNDVRRAYLDAYTQLITDLGGLTADIASASAATPQQAVTMEKPGHLYAKASIKSKMVRSLPVGSTLYPTGEKSDVWWEVTDEIGNKGWVSSMLVALAK
jgi:hypothetical protein